MNKLYYYFLLLPFIFYFLITTYANNYKPYNWIYKIILIYVSLLCIIISMLTNINIINTYLIPALLFFNIAILFYVTLSNSFTLINLISLLGIAYLLITFNYKDFKINKGLLIKPNKIWIYMHIIILSIWYLLSNTELLSNMGKIVTIILILYPLLFPLNEYFIHRGFSLAFICSLYGKYSNYIDKIKF